MGKQFSGLYGKYKEDFDKQGSGEYWVNLALYNNQEIAKKDQELLSNLNQLKKIIYEVERTRKKGERRPDLERQYNRHIIDVKTTLDWLVTALGDWIQTKYNDQAAQESVNQAKHIVNQPYDNVRGPDLIRCATQFHNTLTIKAIVPYTAGYSEETGYSKFRRG